MDFKNSLLSSTNGRTTHLFHIAISILTELTLQSWYKKIKTEVVVMAGMQNMYKYTKY